MLGERLPIPTASKDPSARRRGSAFSDSSRASAKTSGTRFGLGSHPRRSSETRSRRLEGYEIHAGRLERLPTASAAFVVVTRNGRADDGLDGDVSSEGGVVGTMIHGLFDNAGVRRAVLDSLRRRKGIAAPPEATAAPDDPYDTLADIVRDHVDVELLHRLAQLPRPRDAEA